MFSNHPLISTITDKMEYKGHSGASFGMTMRVMEHIAKHGWDSLASKVAEGRAKGLLPDFLRHMEPADWRAVMTNYPITSTEGGKGLSVAGMINILEGLSHLANGRETDAVTQLIGYLKKFAKVAPDYAAFRPVSTVAEANAQAARDALFAEMMAEGAETAAVA